MAGRTEINIVNASSVSQLIALRLVGSDGSYLGGDTATVFQSINANGAFQTQVSSIFPSIDLQQARTLEVRSGGGIAATSVIRGFLVPVESAVLNAVGGSRSSNTSLLNFPYVVNGDNYVTTVGITNLAAAQNVTLTYHPSSGDAPISAQRSLAAGGSLRETGQNLFGLSSTFQTGWIQVSATDAITGFVTYARTVSGGLASVPALTGARTPLLFSHIAGSPAWYTGIALLNATTTDANVEVYAMTPSGSLIGGARNVPTAAFTLKAGTNTARVLSDLIPATAAQNGGFVFVRTTNNVPLDGLEVFFNPSNSIFANVPPGILASGITYTPPALTSPVSNARGKSFLGDFKDIPRSNDETVP